MNEYMNEYVFIIYVTGCHFDQTYFDEFYTGGAVAP